MKKKEKESFYFFLYFYFLLESWSKAASPPPRWYHFSDSSSLRSKQTHYKIQTFICTDKHKRIQRKNNRLIGSQVSFGHKAVSLNGAKPSFYFPDFASRETNKPILKSINQSKYKKLIHIHNMIMAVNAKPSYQSMQKNPSPLSKLE